MRIRAGIVLIQDGKVALIERHRAGLSTRRDRYVFVVDMVVQNWLLRGPGWCA